MEKTHIGIVAKELSLKESQVSAVADLLSEGSTVPFIARYRKERTESLNEVEILNIRDRLDQLKEIDSRRDTILRSLEQNGHLTDDLKLKVYEAKNLSELEDIYLPYRPKRRTKATVAKEKGLEPLAILLFEQNGIDAESVAETYVDSDKEVLTAQDALSGARDIIAEMINEDTECRSKLRSLYLSKGIIRSKVIPEMKETGIKYRDYFEWEEPLCRVPSHRLLAMRRGEKEDILNIDILPPEEEAIAIMESLYIKGEKDDSIQVRIALNDCYKRLLSRAMETEMRVLTKEKADKEAIKVFTENLRQLLMSPPLGDKRVMGIDPGFRTGCKVVCLDRQGKLLAHDTIFPHSSDKSVDLSQKKVISLVETYEIEAVAIGNGTASRETEAFIKSVPFPRPLHIIMVNESGASIYSASEVAREEFPDLDLTVRGSVSIARRLMDPLSELVKIDPKSIGVGQYQHDVDQHALRESLDDTVISCVNSVGVDINRASKQLLTYVSGLGPQLAKNIVEFRNENGAFTTKEDIKKVKRLGPKAFEQSAGFLRIKNGKNPLDESAVHPESYEIVNQMAMDMGCKVVDLMARPDLRSKIDLNRYVSETIGLPTLNDILSELAKPGRDPRKEFEVFSFDQNVETINDLQPGMKLPGIITNITAFGAFVDIGVHQDGLVHISQLSDQYVSDPTTIVKVHQKVTVTVLEVDISRKRISLSMKTNPEKVVPTGSESAPKRKEKPKKAPRETQRSPFNNPFLEAFKKKNLK